MDFTFIDAPTHSTDETLPTDFRIFRHGSLIIKHVRVCRHGILAPDNIMRTATFGALMVGMVGLAHSFAINPST